MTYYNTLEEFATKGDSEPFVDFVATLEEQQLDEYLKMRATNSIPEINKNVLILNHVLNLNNPFKRCTK